MVILTRTTPKNGGQKRIGFYYTLKHGNERAKKMDSYFHWKSIVTSEKNLWLGHPLTH